MQIQTKLKVPTPESEFEKGLEEQLTRYSTDLAKLLNSGLFFRDNFNAEELSFTTHATPDTEFSAAHTLKRTPTRFFVVDRDKAGVLYKGPTAWTGSLVYFRCNVESGAIKVYVY